MLWSTGACASILTELTDVPVLGVCLGHQALAYVHGGLVVKAPEPIHGRLSVLQHNSHPLFKGCPSGHEGGFDVVRSGTESMASLDMCCMLLLCLLYLKNFDMAH